MEENKINGKSEEHFYLENDGITWTEKTPEMKLQNKLITKEEYNKIQNDKREQEYKSKTDKQVIELTRLFLNRNINNMTEEEKALLDEINLTVASIKQELPKQN